MANSTTSFVLGILTVLVIIAGIYMYMDYTKTKTTVADYSTSEPDNDTYIYDKDDEVLEEAIDESIDDSLNDNSSEKGTIAGTLCYPSHFLPEGEVVAKNVSTKQSTVIEVDGQSAEYQIELDPGTYNIRYQAHASGDETFMSGYYTKCSIDPTADVCDDADAHNLIPVAATAGVVVGDIKLCDFYYESEPEF